MMQLVWLLAVLVACAGHHPPRPHHHGHGPALHFDRSPETAAADLPFSDAVRAGNLLFVSGQLGVRPGTTELVRAASRPRRGSVSRTSAPSWSGTARASSAW